MAEAGLLHAVDEGLEVGAARVDDDGQAAESETGAKESARPAKKAPSKKGKAKNRKAVATGGEPSGVDVLQAVLAQQAAALELWELKARLDLPDALHQLRVAARSLRGLLKSARPFLEREAAERHGHAAADRRHVADALVTGN